MECPKMSNTRGKLDDNYYTWDYLSSDSTNILVTNEMDDPPSCLSKLDNANKETTASRIPFLVWVMFSQPCGFQH